MSTQWDEQASPQPGVTLTRASSIKPEPIAWIWPGWLAAGKLHVLAGMAGTGKTTIALAVAATMTARGRWPDGTDCRTAANVVMWSGEDDAADTLVPRLMAMGANVDRVHLITGTTDDKGQKRGFDPSVDMPMLEATLAKVNPRLLILDPISSAVSGDSHQNTEVRRSLQPVVDLAASLGCAVLGITHFSKGTAGRDPLERVTGSMAFGAFARLVWATIKPAKDADDQKRRLIRTKSNIGPDGGGFEYDLAQTNVPGISGLYASCILWGETLEGSARELAGQIEDDKTPGEEKGPSPREEATDFLLEILADGPRMQREIKELADQDGIAWRTLMRAKKGEGVVSTKLAEGWQWHLKNWTPGADADGDQESQGCQESHISKGLETGIVGTLESAEATETPEMLAFKQEGQGDQQCHIPDDALLDGEV
ncbi:MAG: AAA family ATPase [Acidithiobacillus ferrivorans]